MDIALLRDFVAPVSTCFETELLGNVWRLLQQTNGEQVAVIDQQRQPVGLLTLRRLLTLLLETAPGLPLVPLTSADANPTPMQQTLGELRRLQPVQPLLEALTPFPAHWTLDQFQPHLAAIDQGHCVLVDAAGHYVGLLDRLQLLRFLAVHRREREPVPAAVPSSFSPGSCELTRPKAVGLGLDPLLDLLERLPIPLMLQTAAGRVILQNLAWRQQIGELRDPGQVRREAASILEPARDEIHRHYSSGEASSWQGRSVDPHVINPYSDSWDSPVADATPTERTSFCRLSTEPNACVCVCPMKNGQERVWQFIRIPMGAAVSPLLQEWQAAANLASSPSVVTEAIESIPAPLGFKLATLGFSPDPEWRFLAQTESLWLVLAQDMTEQQQVARELAAKNADLMQLNRLKDEFLACISHELKTPLTAVLGLSSLLKDQALGPLNDRQSRYAQLIYQSGRHLILVVNDILDLTRIETGQLELMLETVTLETVCTRAYEQSRQVQPLDVDAETQARQHREEVQFTLEIQPGVTSIVADELRLRQMLVNLLSNAFKFTETGGEIGLSVEVWEGWIAFTVWDTGIGIPVDKQHLIFQKFQQLENPLTRRYEGTGLGLVLTQRLARLHGGDVTFTSVEGQGSQFTLILPPSPPQAGRGVESPVSQSTAITASNRLVLVVEATHKLLEPLTSQLTALGYRVAIARSGTEALEKTRRLQPCLVFLNPLLPLLSGWDVLVLLKADQETQHIPVIVTAMRVEKDQAYQNGANGFLSLPIQTDALQACLDRFADSTPPDAPESLSHLTVLHLYGNADPLSADAAGPPTGPNLSNLLHLHHCRVLEVDDLEQADLLARVWKPDVILVDGVIANPLSYMQQLGDYPFLAALPLITLTAEVTHAANQVAGLVVYPCLHSTASASSLEISTLLQVIQHAVGLNWTPHILIADFSELQADWQATAIAPPQAATPAATGLRSAVSLQALAQYLQIAGFRSSVEPSWENVLHQLQRHSVDLLLLCTPMAEPHPLLLEMTNALEQLEVKPPILIWQTPSTAPFTPAEASAVQEPWGAIATCLLPPTLSMPELLAQINQVLGNHPEPLQAPT